MYPHAAEFWRSYWLLSYQLTPFLLWLLKFTAFSRQSTTIKCPGAVEYSLFLHTHYYFDINIVT
jgi:hypothetical protein